MTFKRKKVLKFVLFTLNFLRNQLLLSVHFGYTQANIHPLEHTQKSQDRRMLCMMLTTRWHFDCPLRESRGKSFLKTVLRNQISN